ncbi:MAG TPA: hypothetical protein VL947_02440 [Cytophagales bacterium]|nr:hypothetical protein [Cytophagales bacterium]
MRDPLKDIYKTTFQHYAVDSDDADWKAIEKKVKFSNFSQFQWMQFNIYYAGAILISFMMTMTATGHYFYQQLTSNPKPDTVYLAPAKQKTLDIEQSLSATPVSKKTTARHMEKTTLGTYDKSFGKVDTLRVTTTQQNAQDTVTAHVKPCRSTDSTAPAKSVPYVKVEKVVIVKRDTVYQVKKKRNLKLFGK